jgi:hypothetical protein
MKILHAWRIGLDRQKSLGEDGNILTRHQPVALERDGRSD